MTKWEYRVVVVGIEVDGQWLNLQGDQGWELCATVDEGSRKQFVFKRKAEAKEQ